MTSSGIRIWIWFGAAVAVEIGGWIWGLHSREAAFAGFRVLSHLGWAGVMLALGVGIVGGMGTATLGHLRYPRPWLTLGVAAAVVHLAFVNLPQVQPDTVNYFVQAQSFVHHPLDTLLGWKTAVWEGPQGRFHKPFPLIPAIYATAFGAAGERAVVADVVMTIFAVGLPLSVALLGRALGHEREGLAAGYLVLAVPYLQAQSGWMLVDVPLATWVCLALAAWVRATSWKGWLLALLITAPALATKITAPLFVAGPAFAMVLGAWRDRRRKAAFVVVGCIALVTIAVVRPTFVREWDTYPPALGAMLLQLRPALWLLVLPALRMRDRGDALIAGALLSLPVVLAYAPVEHAARYALPLAPLLALAAARRIPRPAVAVLVGSGLVMLMMGYRPILVHHQGANLREATRQLQDHGVQSIEVWGDMPGTSFPATAVTALVDYYATVPVTYGGALGTSEPGHKQYWWEFYEPPPWHHGPPGEGVLLGLYGASASEFEGGAGSELQRLDSVSIYRGSSWLLPREVVLYRRGADLMDE